MTGEDEILSQAPEFPEPFHIATLSEHLSPDLWVMRGFQAG